MAKAASVSIQNSFTNLRAQLQPSTSPTALQGWTTALLTAYTEPQRHYHTLTHISSMLTLSRSHCHLITNPLVIELAIYFHDYIYDPRSSTNEVDSITIFRQFSDEFKIPEKVSEKVAHYIAATITHSLDPKDEGDEDLKLFLDFDLEVLGRGKEEYEVYSKQIREEYGHFSQAEYAAGRARVLEKFLGRERLFFSDVFHSELEEQARRNLKMEIGQLRMGLQTTAET